MYIYLMNNTGKSCQANLISTILFISSQSLSAAYFKKLIFASFFSSRNETDDHASEIHKTYICKFTNVLW